MIRRLFAISLGSLAALAVVPSAAHAWVVHARLWTAPVITYRAEQPEALQAARYAAWAWAPSGVRFVEATGRGRADVTVRVYSGCGGEASVGFRRPAFVSLGRCTPSLRGLTAVHEFGHVLGLDHENRGCARMNSVARPSGTPAKCAARPLRWWIAHPLLPDDIEGARWIQRRARALPRAQSRRSDSNR